MTGSKSSKSICTLFFSNLSLLGLFLSLFGLVLSFLGLSFSFLELPSLLGLALSLLGLLVLSFLVLVLLTTRGSFLGLKTRSSLGLMLTESFEKFVPVEMPESILDFLPDTALGEDFSSLEDTLSSLETEDFKSLFSLEFDLFLFFFSFFFFLLSLSLDGERTFSFLILETSLLSFPGLCFLFLFSASLSTRGFLSFSGRDLLRDFFFFSLPFNSFPGLFPSLVEVNQAPM